MTDKKTFGAFIKAKRTEKNYSQKDIAEMLCVTEGAVSKWERGVSYPDITLISDICRVLEISEHELITASTDTDTRKIYHQARKDRVISGVWFWVPTISYAVALLTCFICNLAVNHRLSWFFIVLTALLCAFTFVPNVTCFFKTKKLLAFSVSTYLAIGLLLVTCAVYTGGLSWLLTACIGVLIGYELLFVPILLAKTKVSRYKFVISFIIACGLTVLLLLNINAWHPFMLGPAILVTCYAFTPALFCAVICTLRFDAFLKTAVCIAFSAIVFYFTEYMVDKLLDTNSANYKVNFNDWAHFLEGNVQFICLVSFLLISVVFGIIGILRSKKKS